MTGKGDTYRKLNKDQQAQFDKNFDEIFRKQPADQPKPEPEEPADTEWD